MGWWHLTRFYGNSETVRRSESWVKLKHLMGTSHLPWLFIGDFNEITKLSEKEGGSMRPRKQMELFLDAINHCGLQGVGFVGPKFTWLYQRADGVQIQERLDRALASQNSLDIFLTTKLYHLSSSTSDHSPVSLHMVN